MQSSSLYSGVVCTCKHCQLPLAMTFKDTIKLRESRPLYPSHLLHISQFSIHILPELLEGHNGLVGSRDWSLDNSRQAPALGQCLTGARLKVPWPDKRTALQSKFPGEYFWGFPGAHISPQPQCDFLELLQIRQEDRRQTAYTPWQGQRRKTRSLTQCHAVYLTSREHNLTILPSYQRQAEEVVVAGDFWNCSFSVDHLSVTFRSSWKQLNTPEARVMSTKPGEHQTLGGLEEPDPKFLQCGVGEFTNLKHGFNELHVLIQ